MLYYEWHSHDDHRIQFLSVKTLVSVAMKLTLDSQLEYEPCFMNLFSCMIVSHTHEFGVPTSL